MDFLQPHRLVIHLRPICSSVAVGDADVVVVFEGHGVGGVSGAKIGEEETKMEFRRLATQAVETMMEFQKLLLLVVQLQRMLSWRMLLAQPLK